MSTIEFFMGDLTIIAPERNHRPVGSLQRPTRRWWQFWKRRPVCPFCPGQEALNSDVLRQPASSSEAPWYLRIIKNKWPLSKSCHEVLILSPQHQATLPQLSTVHQFEILHQLRARVAHWRTLEVRVALFINQGRLAGASQEHPHAQIVGLLDGQAVRFPDYGEAVTTVWQSTGIRVNVPKVPEFDGETIIESVRPTPLDEASDSLLTELITALVTTLMLVESQEPGMPYNVIIDPETCRIRVVMRKYARAGIELATGCRVIHYDPSAWAKQLRANMTHP